MTTYGVKAQLVQLGAVTVPPSGQGDFVTLQMPESFRKYVSNGGEVLMVQNSDQSVDIVLMCTPGGKAAKVLGAAWTFQQSRGTAFKGFPFLYRDTTLGDELTGRRCHITKPGDMGGGENPNPREWRLTVEEGIAAYATLVAPGTSFQFQEAA